MGKNGHKTTDKLMDDALDALHELDKLSNAREVAAAENRLAELQKQENPDEDELHKTKKALRKAREKMASDDKIEAAQQEFERRSERWIGRLNENHENYRERVSKSAVHKVRRPGG